MTDYGNDCRIDCRIDCRDCSNDSSHCRHDSSRGSDCDTVGEHRSTIEPSIVDFSNRRILLAVNAVAKCIFVIW